MYQPPSTSYGTLPTSYTFSHNYNTINDLNSSTPISTHTHTSTINRNTYESEIQTNAAQDCGNEMSRSEKIIRQIKQTLLLDIIKLRLIIVK